MKAVHPSHFRTYSEGDFYEFLENTPTLPVFDISQQDKFSLKLKGANMENQVDIIKMSDVAIEEVKWLWYPYIPFGKLTIIHGDPGEGKTFLVIAITAALTKGEAIYGTESHEPMNVIYQTAEDGLADTIKPRLVSVGADCERVLVINEEFKQLSMTDERIEKAIIQNNAKLLILDPLQAYLGADVDMHRANEIRPIMSNLGRVAERTGCAIVMIGHVNKGGGKSSHRGLGSIDIFATARCVLAVGKSPKDPNIRIMAQSKNNLAEFGPSIAFEINDGLKFIGECDVSVDDLLSNLGSRRDVISEAKHLLTVQLANGQKSYEEISTIAKHQNISVRTLKTAKKELDITSTKIGDKWYWKMP